ncbi:hypothetical protein D3C87_1331230 [compost metagenome]
MLDLLLALHHDRQRRGLHPAHRGQEETAALAVERGHRPRAVDADQPVGLRPAARGIGQRHHFLVVAQLRKPVADGLRRHRLQPQPAHRLLGLGLLRDQAEDQLPLAPRIAGVDQAGHVLALDQPVQHLQPRLGLLDRAQVEMRRNHRQIGEAPLAALDLVVVRRGNLHEVAHGRRQHVVIALEVLVVLGKAPEGARDIGGDRWLFRDDEGFRH